MSMPFPDVFGNLATTQHTEVKCTLQGYVKVSSPWSPEAELATGCPAEPAAHWVPHTLCGSGGVGKSLGTQTLDKTPPPGQVESASAEVICYNQVCLSAQSSSVLHVITGTGVGAPSSFTGLSFNSSRCALCGLRVLIKHSQGSPR